MHLTIFLNCFQSARLWVNLYFSKSLLQLKSHQLFECLEILMILEFLSQAYSTVLVNNSTIFFRTMVSDRLEVLMNTISLIKFLMNDFSSLLSLVIDCLWFSEYSSIGIVIVRGVWSDNSLHSRWMVWLSNSTNPYLKNMRLMTKFELWSLSKYLVEIWLVGYNSSSKKESIMSKSNV